MLAILSSLAQDESRNISENSTWGIRRKFEQGKVTVNCTKKRVENNGEVPQYYVEESHPAIIDKDMWEAVQLEIKRRKVFAENMELVK